jgi:catechol 2,3-dioxygenase-like lactoylglutathione lyase family enzyme
MSGLTGIDRVVYGVEDMARCRQFFSDWGLSLVSESAGEIVFETLEKSQIVLRPADDESLPPAIETGSTVREVVWGAASQTDLDAFLSRIASKVTLTEGADGLQRTTDSNGLTIAFQVSQRVDSGVKGTPTNTVDKANRIDQAAPVYPHAEPVRIAHVVFFVPDLEAARQFYVDTLGFNITDEYPGRGLFLRCVEEGTHHNLFLLQTPDKKRGLNHVSFQLRDIYEVTGGGIHVSKQGWETQLGPGRHPISSAFFWYFFCPAGALVEYYSDEDYFTADWQARQHEPVPENYAEWAIVGGISGDTRRQKYREESDLPPLKK